jgi:hypothetical protein
VDFAYLKNGGKFEVAQQMVNMNQQGPSGSTNATGAKRVMPLCDLISHVVDDLFRFIFGQRKAGPLRKNVLAVNRTGFRELSARS